MKDLCLEYFDTKLRKLVLDENANQLAKWGIQDHQPAEWLMFLTEEQGELAEAIAEWQYRNGHERNVIKEAIQVATLALKVAEMFIAEEDKRFIETYYPRKSPICNESVYDEEGNEILRAR